MCGRYYRRSDKQRITSAWLCAVDCMPAGQKRASLLETGNLGIDFGNQLGCVHAGQCNPSTFLNLSTTKPSHARVPMQKKPAERRRAQK